MLRGLGWLVNDPGASFRCRVSPIPAHRFDRALLSALRKGELLSLAWPNVDLQNRVIRVERSRNRERRDIPMTERVSTAWYNALEASEVENFTFAAHLRLKPRHGGRGHPGGSGTSRARTDRDDDALRAPHRSASGTRFQLLSAREEEQNKNRRPKAGLAEW